MADKNGILNQQDKNTLLNQAHLEIAVMTNHDKMSGRLSDALVGADVFVGVSRPGLVTKEMVATMNRDAIIFAMANPEPEIFPEEAKLGGAAVVGTGRADYPNMINNIVAFPGILKGALSVAASDINQKMCLAAAIAIAGCVKEQELGADFVFPDPLNPQIASVVSKAVAETAKQSGIARLS